MCGFAGFVGYGQLLADEVQAVALRMGEAIRHRGPDDSGVWRDDAAQLALVHRRLSILDLSAAGHQPMRSASGRYVIAFNGEIYNHLVLRRELELPVYQARAKGATGGHWRGHSDTETLLAAVELWGLEEALRRSVGMFALALWDRQERALYLARDRMGEKPLYYGRQRDVFLFGSELKALKAHPAFLAELDRDAITLYLRHNYIPAPYSIYRGIRKLSPGNILRLDATHGEQVWAYWSVADVVRRGRMEPFAGDDVEAVDALDDLLRAAVAQQMLADVRLGAFLSGGVDSSTIVALMQAQSARPVRTFSIGFDEDAYNEAEHAKAVARHLGTDHTELYVTPRQTLDVVPRLPTLYDEPFADSSQIPTFLVAEMARRHVTVALSGDAGDELFGGYTRYVRSAAIWSRLQRLPPALRSQVPKVIRTLSVTGWDRVSAPFKPLIPPRMRNVGDKAHKLAGMLSHRDQLGFYRSFVSHWPSPEAVVIGATEPGNYYAPMFGADRGLEYTHAMMATDAVTYLPDDILCKVDRAAMGVSLETRVPLLDHRVVEFAWQLPLTMKIRHGEGKWILRQVLHRYVPKELIERPKMGFGVPLDSWLRGPLRNWAQDLLDESRLRQDGILRPEPIREKWIEHVSGRRDWQYQLWDVLMFQAWLDKERGR